MENQRADLRRCGILVWSNLRGEIGEGKVITSWRASFSFSAILNGGRGFGGGDAMQGDVLVVREGPSFQGGIVNCDAG